MDQDIVPKIEQLRKELVAQGMKMGFQDPEVIKTSQMLDELINKYYRLTNKVENQKKTG